jgi:quinol monooxygenase YgiN
LGGCGLPLQGLLFDFALQQWSLLRFKHCPILRHAGCFVTRDAFEGHVAKTDCYDIVAVVFNRDVRTMIQARLTIFAHPNRREEMVRSIRMLMRSSRLDSGCLDCRLYSDVADPNALTLIEEWATQSDMERRLRSAAYGQLLQLVELSRQPPETVFHTITETSGIEAIQQNRLPGVQNSVRGEGV